MVLDVNLHAVAIDAAVDENHNAIDAMSAMNVETADVQDDCADVEDLVDEDVEDVVDVEVDDVATNET